MTAHKTINHLAKRSSEVRKQLGQYFTGVPLARLLAALSGAESARSIIDPMAGSGDMLVACQNQRTTAANYVGIEIDPIAHAQCESRAPFATVVLGSAFNPEHNKSALSRRWDLVITNPPYVRYQRLKRDKIGIHLPSAKEVRQGLITSISHISGLAPEDKNIFIKLATSYSGLADLALPSIILCCALCAEGGKIAMVVPESWLSRDYAAAAQYALLRFFRIEFVIEDAHASWFEDAQIKTTLLVAKRVPRRDSAVNSDPWSILRIRLPGLAMGPRGIVDRLFPEADNSEAAFANEAKAILAGGVPKTTLDVSEISSAIYAENLLRNVRHKAWFSDLEINLGPDRCGEFSMPDQIAKWLSRFPGKSKFTTLEELGAHVGQGLRTGANSFFYVDKVRSIGKQVLIKASAMMAGTEAIISSDLALPVLRRQAELPEDYVIRPEKMPGMVLAISGHATERDILASGAAADYAALPPGICKLIALAEAIDFSEEGTPPRRIMELSAVAPNIRAGGGGRRKPPRFWYMLPELAPRHIPDLVVPRVVGSSIKAYLNSDRAVVIDANFSTIWTNGHSHSIGNFSALAVLNSSWCAALLELTAAVMGGGALKVEAAHLRRLPIPVMSPGQWKSLAKLGECLVTGDTSAAIQGIDLVISSAASNGLASVGDVEFIRRLSADSRGQRASHRKNIA